MKALIFLICLTLLVVTHELGHLFFAKLFHTRVRRFYVFFNWKFSTSFSSTRIPPTHGTRKTCAPKTRTTPCGGSDGYPWAATATLQA